MSLVVTVRTLDGVVIAGDTLTSVTLTPKTPPAGQPVATSSFAASRNTPKVFPFLESSFGVGVVGSPIVGGKSVGAALRELDAELAQNPKAAAVGSVEAAAQRIGARIRSLKANDPSLTHVICCGFDAQGASPITAEVTVQGGNVQVPAGNPHTDPGVTASGENSVMRALSKMTRRRQVGWGFEFFSLRDAVEYATFLIRTTRDYQRFSLQPQTVGGGIDIGLIERGRAFRWIQRQSRASPAGK